MDRSKLLTTIVALGAFAAVGACGSSGAPTTQASTTSPPTTSPPSTTPTTIATTAPSTTQPVVHTTIRIVSPGTSTTTGPGTFEAPPLGSGTWTQATFDTNCSCAKSIYHFTIGDQLFDTATIAKTSQSNPPPPAIGSTQTMDVIVRVTGGTGRFTHARGVLRGPSVVTVLAFDPNTGNGKIKLVATQTGDITLGS